MLAFGVVFLVLGICGVWYWQYVETQTLHLQERNFRALAVTSHALGKMVANYEKVFNSVIEGEPPCHTKDDLLCKAKAYTEAVEALPDLQDVAVAKETVDLDGFSVKFVSQNGVSPIQLTYVNHDREKTGWKIKAVINIGAIMRQLVTEDIFSDVLLADRMGRVLYHHLSTRDPSGFEFEDVSALLHRLNGSESKEGGGGKGGERRNEDLVSTLPLFNEVPIGGISHAIFAQATDLPADRGTAQIVILVGIVPAGQFHVESRAIALNALLVIVGLMLAIFLVLPYVKLRINAPTERLTLISVAVLIVSSILGVALLTFGLADIATYRNLEQHLDARLEVVSEEIRKQFNNDVQLGINQLAMFDQSCKGECSDNLLLERSGEPHLAQRLCIGMNENGKEEKGFSFFSTDSDNCSESEGGNSDARVNFPDVNTMFWVGSNGGLKVLRSREPNPWKYANLKEREYVRRILDDETFRSKVNKEEAKFRIPPPFSFGATKITIWLHQKR